MSCLIWIQTVWHHNVLLKEFLEKVDFEKNSTDSKKACKITQGAKTWDSQSSHYTLSGLENVVGIYLYIQMHSWQKKTLKWTLIRQFAREQSDLENWVHIVWDIGYQTIHKQKREQTTVVEKSRKRVKPNFFNRLWQDVSLCLRNWKFW